jgi:hypothetical protein
MPGSMGGSWKRSTLRQPNMAALGKPRDLSPVSPTASHLASSLPDQPLAGLAEVNADRLIGSARTRTVGIDARGQ